MTAQLTDPSIQTDLRILLISEVGGVETFAVAERYARNAADREMWEMLRSLEVKTRAGVYEHLGDIAHRFATSERAAELVGRASGAGLALMPHHLQMHALTTATKGFLPRFKKLHNHFRDNATLEPFFAFVVAHELAIAEVGRRGLQDDEQVLQPVRALLG